MKRSTIIALSALLTLGASASVSAAGYFDEYNDYQNEDGTYSYYFAPGVIVTMDEEWYQNTIVIAEEGGATFYHKDSYEGYQKEGYKGGRLFTLGASVNQSFTELPHFEYIGFNEEDAMNYYADLPTDYQAYPYDPAVEEEYSRLYAGVEEVIDSIVIVGQEAEDSVGGPEPAPAGGPEPAPAGEPDPSADAAVTVKPVESLFTIEQANGASVTEPDEDDPNLLPGGWYILEDNTVTPEAMEIFNQAMAEVLDVAYVPQMLLATRTAEETVYCFLAKDEGWMPESVPGYVLVYASVDPEGNVHLADMQDIRIGL